MSLALERVHGRDTQLFLGSFRHVFFSSMFFDYRKSIAAIQNFSSNYALIIEASIRTAVIVSDSELESSDKS